MPDGEVGNVKCFKGLRVPAEMAHRKVPPAGGGVVSCVFEWEPSLDDPATFDIHGFFSRSSAWELPEGGQMGYSRVQEERFRPTAGLLVRALAVCLAIIALRGWDWGRDRAIAGRMLSTHGPNIGLGLVAAWTSIWMIPGLRGLPIHPDLPVYFLVSSSLLMAPVLEELICRGCIQYMGAKCFDWRWAAGASVLVFVALHELTIPRFFWTAACGVMLAWLFHKHRSILLCIAVHALLNSVALGKIFLTDG